MMRNRFLGAAILILLLASALRFHQIETQSFWNDEGNSARLSERSVQLIIEGTASDIHPPLYYLVLRGWREILGDSELALRVFSAFVGVSLVAATIAFGRRLIGTGAEAPSLIAGLLVAINPALVYYSQETRMYEMLAFLAVLSTLLLVIWLQGGGRRLGLAVAYVLSSVAGLYTHYFFPAVLVTQSLIFLLWFIIRHRSGDEADGDKSRTAIDLRPVGRWIVMMLAIMLLYAPWITTYLQQAGDRDPFRSPFQEFLLDSLRWSAFGFTVDELFTRWLVPVFVVLALLGAWFGRNRRNKGLPYTSTLLLSIIVPLVLMWILGATQPAFFKFMLVVIPPICLLTGPGWWWGWRWSFAGSGSISHQQKPKHVGDAGSPADDGIDGKSSTAGTITGRILMLTLAGAVLIGSGRSLLNMYYDPAYARADYRGIAEQIAVEAHSNAGIVLNAANQWEVFTYYHQDGAPVYPVPRGYPDPAVIDDELSQITAQHERIYAVYWGESERDPNRLVERWLDENAFKARDEWRGDVRFVTYAVPAPASEIVDKEIEGITNVRFGEAIYLERAELFSDDLKPGEILQIALHWRADEILEQRYKVFLHLVDENGSIVAQRDSEPGGGLALTTTWMPGETVVDNHGLLVPVGTEPGEYRLLLGLYETFNPLARLPLSLVDNQGDALPLATITVGETEG